jgi:hydrogenase nickel incorporation protein HypB
MCNVCGCGTGEVRIEGREPAAVRGHDHPHSHADGTVHSHAHDHGADQAHVHQHDHGADQGHVHPHDHADYGAGPAGAHVPGLSQARMVRIEQDILAKNDEYASANRQRLAERGVFALNLVSGPGAGKTALLVRTIEALAKRLPVTVIEGDQQTSMDADRIRDAGARAIQINTGKGCHLDAHMVGHAIESLAPPEGSLLMIENVGNLVCPSAFDLGEAHKVVVLSATEGEDKPLKYPDMFRAASVMLLNKIDLLPYLRFDVDVALANARRVNPGLRIVALSALTGEGFDDWLTWLEQGVRDARQHAVDTVDALRARVADLEARLAAARG